MRVIADIAEAAAGLVDSTDTMLRRARPLLGTVVEIAIEPGRNSRPLAAVDAAFAEIEAVHRLMSFHDPSSDVSRINRAAAGQLLIVDPRTIAVLRWAQRLSRASDGVFDITVAPALVAAGLLPAPADGAMPDCGARWADVLIGSDRSLRVRRRLWLDLGGIAKGYAVDRAVAQLRASGIRQGSVNAGGDLRVFGPRAQRIELRDGMRLGGAASQVELADAAIAASAIGGAHGEQVGTHIDGITRKPAAGETAVAVVADQCVMADGLTKVALVDAALARRCFTTFRAQACRYGVTTGWRFFDSIP